MASVQFFNEKSCKNRSNRVLVMFVALMSSDSSCRRLCGSGLDLIAWIFALFRVNLDRLVRPLNAPLRITFNGIDSFNLTVLLKVGLLNASGSMLSMTWSSISIEMKWRRFRWSQLLGDIVLCGKLVSVIVTYSPAYKSCKDRNKFKKTFCEWLKGQSRLHLPLFRLFFAQSHESHSLSMKPVRELYQSIHRCTSRPFHCFTKSFNKIKWKTSFETWNWNSYRQATAG